MTEVTDVVGEPDDAGERRHASRLLRFFCLLAVLACAALWAASLAATFAVDGSTVRMLRVAMLHPGMTMFALALGGAAFAAARLHRHVRDRNLERLRERICFVATVAALVLLPSALLAWRWAAAARPVAGIGVALAMEAIAQLVVLALLVRNARDAMRLTRQRARRSISSIL